MEQIGWVKKLILKMYEVHSALMFLFHKKSARQRTFTY